MSARRAGTCRSGSGSGSGSARPGARLEAYPVIHCLRRCPPRCRAGYLKEPVFAADGSGSSYWSAVGQQLGMRLKGHQANVPI